MKSGSEIYPNTVRRIALSLPGVEEGPSYGTPGFRVKGRFMARFWEDGETLVVKCGHAESEFWQKYDPEIFFITDHYRGYPTVLVRMARVSEENLREVLEQAWRFQAPKKLLAEFNRER
jgi:hypothetical protein